MANQFFQSSKSTANLQRVLGIFCSNDKAADLYKQVFVGLKERGKKSKGICKKLPMTKGQEGEGA